MFSLLMPSLAPSLAYVCIMSPMCEGCHADAQVQTANVSQGAVKSHSYTLTDVNEIGIYIAFSLRQAHPRIGRGLRLLASRS